MVNCDVNLFVLEMLLDGNNFSLQNQCLCILALVYFVPRRRGNANINIWATLVALGYY